MTDFARTETCSTHRKKNLPKKLASNVAKDLLCSLFLYFLSFFFSCVYVYVVCIFKNITFFKLLFIPIVCVHGKIGGCVEVATLFLKIFIRLVVCSCCWQMVMKARTIFVFVPSRSGGYRPFENLKWTQGGVFTLFTIQCLCCFVCQTWNEENNIRSFHTCPPVDPPISCPTLFMLMNVVSHIFFHFFRMANYISRAIFPILLMYVNPFNKF